MSKLSPFLAKIINTNLTFAESLIDEKVTNEIALASIHLTFDKIISTVNVLADDNSADGEQIVSIWKGILADPKALELIENSLNAAIVKIQTPVLKEGLTLITKPIVKTISIITDGNPDNKAQLEQVWEDFIKSPEVVDFLSKYLDVILTKVLKNEKIAELITSLVRYLLTK